MKTKGVSSIFLGQGITAVLSLLFQILIARILLPEGRGDYALYVTYGSILVIATFFGNEFGLRYRYTNLKSSLDQTVSLLILCILIGLSVSAGILLLTRFFVTYDLIKALLSTAMAYSFLFSRQLNVILSLSKRFKTSAIALVVEELIRVLFIGIVWLTCVSIEGVMLASIGASTAVAAWQLSKLNFIKVRIPARQEFYATYLFGLKALIYSFTNFSQIHVVVFVLSLFVPSEQIGVFSIATGLSSRISLLPDTFNRVVIPQLVNQQDRNYFFKAISTLLIAILFCVILLLIIQKILIQVLFGTEYASATIIFPCLLFAALAKGLSKPFEAYYSEFLGRASLVSAVNFATLVLSTALLYFGLSVSSITTAYWLFALGQTLGVGVFFYINRHKALYMLNVRYALDVITKNTNVMK